MRRLFGSLCMMLSTLAFFASCLSTDEEQITLYGDTAITSFKISTAKQTHHTTSSTGTDSVYVTTETLSDYPFSIDHVNGIIENADSLPLGTDATKMLCTYSSKNNGMVYIENLKGDSIKYLQTTDSTDFSSPRRLRVFASDGSAARVYTVKVNIRTEDPDVFTWTAFASQPDFAAFTTMKAVSMNGKIFVAGSDGTTTTIYSTGEDDGNTWTRTAGSLPATAAANVVVLNNVMYLTDGGVLKSSADGSSFSTVGDASAIGTLAGSCHTALYALGTNGQLLVSTDNGATWTADATDDAPAYLPATDITAAAVKLTNDNAYTFVLAGNRATGSYAADKNAMVWTKTVETDEGSESHAWTCVNTDSTATYGLPRMSPLSIVNYNGRLYAIGGQGTGASTVTPYATVYESRDAGITWKKSTKVTIPSGLDTTAKAMTMTTDSKGRIWLITGGGNPQLWRGRLNGQQ